MVVHLFFGSRAEVSFFGSLVSCIAHRKIFTVMMVMVLLLLLLLLRLLLLPLMLMLMLLMMKTASMTVIPSRILRLIAVGLTVVIVLSQA